MNTVTEPDNLKAIRKVAFKKLKKYFGIDKVRMATAEEIMKVTGAVIGSVSMISPDLRTLIDSGISDLDYCYGSCGVEKFTLKICAKNLFSLTRAEVGDFADER